MFNKLASYLFNLLFLCPAWFWAQGTAPDPTELLNQANKQYEQKQFEQSKQVLNRLLTTKTIDPIYDSIRLEALLLNAMIHHDQGLYSDALDIALEAEHHYEQQSVNIPNLLSLIYHRQVMNLVRLGRYIEGLKVAERNYELVKSSDDFEDSSLHTALLLLGVVNYRLYNTHQCIAYYEELLELMQITYGEGHIKTKGVIGNLGLAYADLRRFEKAYQYMRRSYQIVEETYGPDYIDLRWSHFNLGHILQEKGEYSQATHHYQKSIEIFSRHTPNHPYIGENYRRLGQCELYNKNFSRAKQYFDKTLAFYHRLEETSLERIGEIYHAYGDLYAEMGDLPEAIKAWDQAYAKTMMALGSQHPWLSTYKRKQATAFANLGQNDKAEQALDDAFDIFRPIEIMQEDLETFPSKNHIYSILNEAGGVYLELYKHQEDAQYLYKSLDYFDRGIDMLDILRRDLYEENSKFQLNEGAVELYERAIESAYLLWNITQDQSYAVKMIELSELSRRSTLLEALLSQDIKGFPGLPPRLVEREKSIKRNLAQLEQNSVEVGQTVPQDSNALSEQNEWFKSKKELYAFLDSLQDNYPEYYEYRYATSPPDLSVVQASLPDDQLILEFFDADQFLYVFGITSDQFQIDRIPKEKNLTQDIYSFMNHLGNGDTVLSDPGKSIQLLSSLGYRLYQNLVETILPEKNIRDVVIVPDDMVSRIPFELLLTEKPQSADPKDWPFLFQQLTISYHQSILLGMVQEDNERKSRHGLSLWIPDYNAFETENLDTLDHPMLATLLRSGHLPLPGAVEEAGAIQDIFTGEIYAGNQATEKQFVQHAGNASIIHFSGHAILNPENPARSKFVFTPDQDSLYDGFLSSAEICHLDLQAELAVLSACHTGAGQFRRGEGVISLGRAFAFAGVPSSVLSLWKAPDRTTAQLIPKFYQGLKKGLTKSDALNFARNAYLQEAKIQELKHPFYWGGFIMYGNSDAIVHTGFGRISLWIGISTILLIISLITIKRFSSL